MSALPGAGPLVVLVAGLVGEEGGRVELAAAVDQGGLVHLVEHLVIDDPLDEVAGHEGAVERPVDPDQALLDRIGAHLDAVAPARLAAALAPGDAGLDGAAEVALVE